MWERLEICLRVSSVSYVSIWIHQQNTDLDHCGITCNAHAVQISIVITFFFSFFSHSFLPLFSSSSSSSSSSSFLFPFQFPFLFHFPFPFNFPFSFLLIIFIFYQVILFLGYPLQASSISLTREKDSGPVLWNLKYFDSNWRIFVAEDGNYFILQKNVISKKIFWYVLNFNFTYCAIMTLSRFLFHCEMTQYRL